MSSKYVDTKAIVQVIGCVFNNPSLLEDETKYSITDADFPDKFHKIVFGVLYNLYQLGVKEFSILNIEDFLKDRPTSEGIFNANKGAEWVEKASQDASLSSFQYYYDRLKKMTLLRAYDSIGVNVSDIYNPDNILDIAKHQEQEEKLDNSSLVDLANYIDNKILKVRTEFVDETFGQSYEAGYKINELIEELKQHPEYGAPLYGGGIMNAITRGARTKKLFLRSGASGYGKTRTMAADACYLSCGEIYDNGIGWHPIGSQYPTLFITTELTVDEVQTMFLAFLSGVNESHILDGKYEPEEEERVLRAAEILKSAPLYIEEIMDFNLQDIENIIKKYINEKDVRMVLFDYIHSSLKILAEIASQTKGMKLREDNVLFILSNKLKNICNEHDVFILSGTQLSGDWRNSETPDQQLLRGARSLADWTKFYIS